MMKVIKWWYSVGNPAITILTRTNYSIILWCLRYFLTFSTTMTLTGRERPRSSVRWRLMIKIIPVFLLIAPEVSSERRVTLQPAILIFCKICRFLRRWVFSDEQRGELSRASFDVDMTADCGRWQSRHWIIVALWLGQLPEHSSSSPQSLPSLSALSDN